MKKDTKDILQYKVNGPIMTPSFVELFALTLEYAINWWKIIALTLNKGCYATKMGTFVLCLVVFTMTVLVDFDRFALATASKWVFEGG